MASYQKLTPMDRVFLDIESGNSHMHVAATMIFEAGPLATREGGIDIDRVREQIASRLHLIPRYRQKLIVAPITGEAVWVDDSSFNINYHVRHAGLPKPGDDRLLKRLSGRIMSQQLDRGKPLWECWVIEGLEDGRWAMISKTHHCMIDGISGVDLMAVLLSPFPEEEVKDAPHWTPEREPGPWEVLGNELLHRAATPIEAVRGVCASLHNPIHSARTIVQSISALGETLSATSHRASDTPLNRNIGPHRRFDWLEFRLDDVKAVKNALGGTVNDVVLATVSGALGRFLARRGVTQSIQEEMEIKAFCPVSVRSESERGALGNRISGMVIDLPIYESDARRRIKQIISNTRGVKESKQALGAEVLAAVSEWTTPTLLSLSARLATETRVYNLVVTNVPGPQIPLYMQGAKMLQTYPMAPLFRNQGLNIALFSYAGGLYWGFNADYDVMPDLHDMVEAVRISFLELCQAAGVTPDACVQTAAIESDDSRQPAPQQPLASGSTGNGVPTRPGDT